MGTTGTARSSRSCSSLPFQTKLRVEGGIAGIEQRLGSVFVLGHEVAQLLGGDVGALVFVADGLDGRRAVVFSWLVFWPYYLFSIVVLLLRKCARIRFSASHGSAISMKCPASETAVVVDCRHPERSGGGDLGRLVLSSSRR